MVTTTDNRELLRSTSDQRGGRFYTNGGRSYASVTTAIGAGLPKPALMGWAKRVTAEYAVENIDLLVPMVERDPKGAVSWLKSAADNQRDESAGRGTDLHDIAERIALGEVVNPADVEPKLRGMVTSFVQFVEAVEPTFIAVEAVVYNDTHMYAGTLDMIIQTRHPAIERWYERENPTILTDIKTSKDVYADTALQLAAYKNADYINLGDGQTVPMVEVDGGMVLNIRPRSWKLVPLEIGDAAFTAFKRVLGVAHWQWQGGANVVGPPLVTS